MRKKESAKKKQQKQKRKKHLNLVCYVMSVSNPGSLRQRCYVNKIFSLLKMICAGERGFEIHKIV